MAIRQIISYPDARLALPCSDVQVFDETLNGLINDLTDTMRAAPGVGITAAHIGILQRVFVLELKPGIVETFINPKITASTQHLSRYTEGSVSMPGMTDEVERPASISLTYRTVSGDMVERDADGFFATCIQHEIDQLDGIFWIKRLSRLKRERLIRRWEKQRKA